MVQFCSQRPSCKCHHFHLCDATVPVPEALIAWGHQGEEIQRPQALMFPLCVSECRPWTHFSTSSEVKCRRKRQWFLAEKSRFWEEANTKPFLQFLSSVILPPARPHGSKSELPGGEKIHLIRGFGEKEQTEERFGTTFYYIAFSVQKSSIFTLGFRVFSPSALEMSEVIGVHL